MCRGFTGCSFYGKQKGKESGVAVAFRLCCRGGVCGRRGEGGLEEEPQTALEFGESPRLSSGVQEDCALRGPVLGRTGEVLTSLLWSVVIGSPLGRWTSV